MKVLAITTRGSEYVYAYRTAHKVNARKAQAIADILNEKRYMLHDDAHLWHVYEIDQHDNAYIFASDQEFRAGKRGIIRRGY